MVACAGLPGGVMLLTPSGPEGSSGSSIDGYRRRAGMGRHHLNSVTHLQTISLTICQKSIATHTCNGVWYELSGTGA